MSASGKNGGPVRMISLVGVLVTFRIATRPYMAQTVAAAQATESIGVDAGPLHRCVAPCGLFGGYGV